MAQSETTQLLQKKNAPRVNKDGVIITEYNSDWTPFRRPQTTEQAIFLCFLIIIVGGVISLTGYMIFAESATSRITKQTARSDVGATAAVKLLNSLYHENSSLQPGCESTLLMMRHCDKLTDWAMRHGGADHCSYMGRERAYFLSTLFGPGKRWPAPSKIFSLTAERHYRDRGDNFRELETVYPLAYKFNLEIDVYGFKVEELARDYFELLQEGIMCGKTTVVAWKHDIMPELAVALACGPNQGCPQEYPEDTFDEVWQIKFVYDEKRKAKSQGEPMKLPVHTRGPIGSLMTSAPDSTSSNATTNNAAPAVAANDDDDYDDDDDDDDETSESHHRLLRRKRKVHKTKPGVWTVMGTKTFQHFDPLAFSFAVGDYPEGGDPSGGRWIADEI